MIRKISSIFVLTLLIFSACKKTEKPLFHIEYFGMQEGRYVIYDAVEITHDALLSQHDTVYYELKTVWGPEYINNEGQSTKEFHRYKRTNPSDAWAFLDLWTGRIDGIRAELVEENQRVVKLVFAPTDQKVWNSNEYNMLEEQECYYQDIHKSFTINNIKIDSTLKVNIEESSNLIDSVEIYERYAKNIGLVYKHYKDNHYQFTDEVYLGKELYLSYKSSGIE